MAIRTDFTIDWSASPRVIIINAPSVEVTMQDLHDTLRNEESKPENMDDPPIVDTSGKETLDSTTKVGLTVTLQNAVCGFAARSGPAWELVSYTGGNLVAVAADLVTNISPVYPTAFVTPDRATSSSATIVEVSTGSGGETVVTDIPLARWHGVDADGPFTLNVGHVYDEGGEDHASYTKLSPINLTISAGIVVWQTASSFRLIEVINGPLLPGVTADVVYNYTVADNIVTISTGSIVWEAAAIV